MMDEEHKLELRILFLLFASTTHIERCAVVCASVLRSHCRASSEPTRPGRR
jgi:hypothetical protein